MINVILADDHEVVRTGIKLLLEADPDIAVVAEAAEGTQAYSLVAQHKRRCCCLTSPCRPGKADLWPAKKWPATFPTRK